MKKTLLMFMTVLFALSMMVSTASAAAGWQTIGNDIILLDKLSKTTTGGVFTSNDHGNIGVKIPDHGFMESSISVTYSPYMQIKVYEYDSASSRTLIGTAVYYPDKMGTKTFSFNVDKYRDGANNKAEIRVVYYTNYHSAHFRSTILD